MQDLQCDGDVEPDMWVGGERAEEVLQLGDAVAHRVVVEVLQAGGLGEMTKGLMPDPRDFPGIAVKTEMDMKGRKVTTTLLSIKEEPVEAAVFELPPEYREATAPAFNLPAPK